MQNDEGRRMKWGLAALLVTLSLHCFADDVFFGWTNSVNGAAGRKVILTPLALFPAPSQVAVYDRLSATNGTDGTLTVSNLTAGLWQADLLGPPDRTRLCIGVEHNGTGGALVDASTIGRATPESVRRPQDYAYSAQASDARYAAAGTGNGSTNVLYSSRLGAYGDTSLQFGGGHDDWAILQAALDRASNGPLRLVIERPSLVSTGLVQRSNTEIEFLPGAGLFLRSGANCPVLWSAMPAGAGIASSNMVVRGGLLNCNGWNQSRALGALPDCWTVGVWFGGCNSVLLDGVTCSNSQSFAFVLSGPACAVRWQHCQALWGPECGVPNQDGWHFWGSITNVALLDFLSNGNDDAFGFGMNEMDSIGLPWFEEANPHYTVNCLVSGGTLYSANIGRFYTSGTSQHISRFCNLVIEHIHAFDPVNGLNCSSIPKGGPVDTLTLRDWRVTLTKPPASGPGNTPTFIPPLIGLNETAGNVIIENIELYDTQNASVSPVAYQGQGATLLVALSDLQTNVVLRGLKVFRPFSDPQAMVSLQEQWNDPALPRVFASELWGEGVAGGLIYGASVGSVALASGVRGGFDTPASSGSFSAFTSGTVFDLGRAANTNKLTMVGCPVSDANGMFYWSVLLHRYTNDLGYGILLDSTQLAWVMTNASHSGVSFLYDNLGVPDIRPATSTWEQNGGGGNEVPGMVSYFVP